MDTENGSLDSLDNRLTRATGEKGPAGVRPVNPEGDPRLSDSIEVVTPHGRRVEPNCRNAEEYADHMLGLDQPPQYEPYR